MNSQELLEYLARVVEENPVLEQEDSHALNSAYSELKLKANWLDAGSSPSMGTGQMSPVMIAAGRLIASREARKVGEDHPSPVVDRLAFGAYNKFISPSRTAFDWLSVNEENVNRYIADPLCGGRASTGLFREMLGGIAYISKSENLKKMNMTTPILFVSGSMCKEASVLFFQSNPVSALFYLAVSVSAGLVAVCLGAASARAVGARYERRKKPELPGVEDPEAD